MLYTDLTFISDTDTKGPGQGAVLADYATSMLLSCGKLNLAEQALLRSDTSRLHEQKTYSAYRNFVQGHLSELGCEKGLAWSFMNHDNSCVQLTEARIKTAIIILFKRRKQEWKCDFLRRSGGTVLASDATHKVIGRTDSEANNLVFILGDDQTILWFGACRSEAWAELGPALDKLADRHKRHGTDDKVVGWYTDTCCNGLNQENMGKHKLLYRSDGAGVEVDGGNRPPAFQLRYPNLVHCPFLDLFHAHNRVTQATNQAAVGEVEELSADISTSLFYMLQGDVNTVVQYLMSPRRKKHAESAKGPRPLNRTEAEIKAVRDYRRDGIIRSYPFPVQKQVENLRGKIEKWKRRKEQAKRANLQCAIRSHTNRRRGTIREMELLLEHVEKGCVQYPLPCEEMWIPIRKQPQTGLQERLAIQGTSKVESVNGTVNRIVDGTSHISRELVEPYFWARALYHNHERDRKLGREDRHCIWLDAHRNSAINADAGRFLAGPLPFPRADQPEKHPLLPPPAKFTFIPLGHSDDEDFGFDYLDALLKRDAERDAMQEVTAGATAEVRDTMQGAESSGDEHCGNSAPSADHVANESRANEAFSEDDAEAPFVQGPHMSKRRKPKATANKSGGLPRTSNMKTPIGRAYGLRICKPTSEAERQLAATAAEQATRELPQLNRATYDRATAIYNGLAIQKAATDSLFSVHQTSRKHMRAFCFESHAKFIATLRLTNALGTNPAPPESSIEADRNASTVGSTTDADTGIQPGMRSASDILSSLATLSTTNVSTAPDIPTPNTMQSTPAPQQEHSRHAAYAAKTRDAPLTVEHSKVAQLLVPHLKRLARHLNVPQKVDGSNKDKPKLIADIVARWDAEMRIHGEVITVR